MINTVGFETCIGCLGLHTIPDGKGVSHLGILYRCHAKQIVIYELQEIQILHPL